MPWEQRKGGSTWYYTHTWRENGHVIRTYVGTGPEAEKAAAEDLVKRAERKAQAESRKAEEQRYEEIDVSLGKWSRTLQELMTAVLMLGGYHKHVGEWRKGGLKDEPTKNQGGGENLSCGDGSGPAERPTGRWIGCA